MGAKFSNEKFNSKPQRDHLDFNSFVKGRQKAGPWSNKKRGALVINSVFENVSNWHIL